MSESTLPHPAHYAASHHVDDVIQQRKTKAIAGKRTRNDENVCHVAVKLTAGYLNVDDEIWFEFTR